MTIFYAGASFADISSSLNEALGVSLGLYPSWGNASAGTRYNSNLYRGYTSLQNNEYENVISLGTDTDEVWFHAELHQDSNNTIADLTLVGFYGSAGNLLNGVVSSTTGAGGNYNLRKSTTGTSYAAAYSGSAFTLSATSLSTIDIYLKIAASGGEFSVYKDGGLAGTFSGDTTANGSNLVRFIRVAAGHSGSLRRWSGIVCADENTIGWKVQDLYPVSGTQAFSGWTGDYSVLDDYAWSISKTDSAYANANNVTSSYAANDTHSSMSSLVPAGLAISARGFNTADSAVSGLELGVAIGGTYYGSGVTETFTPEEGDKPVQHIFTANPSNSSGWTHADFDAMQIAIRAKT
jgi:hypothetical protein